MITGPVFSTQQKMEPFKNVQCFLCRQPTSDYVFFQLGDHPVKVCMACDDKMNTRCSSDAEFDEAFK